MATAPVLVLTQPKEKPFFYRFACVKVAPEGKATGGGTVVGMRLVGESSDQPSNYRAYNHAMFTASDGNMLFVEQFNTVPTAIYLRVITPDGIIVQDTAPQTGFLSFTTRGTLLCTQGQGAIVEKLVDFPNAHKYTVLETQYAVSNPISADARATIFWACSESAVYASSTTGITVPPLALPAQYLGQAILVLADETAVVLTKHVTTQILTLWQFKLKMTSIELLTTATSADMAEFNAKKFMLVTPRVYRNTGIVMAVVTTQDSADHHIFLLSSVHPTENVFCLTFNMDAAVVVPPPGNGATLRHTHITQVITTAAHEIWILYIYQKKIMGHVSVNMLTRTLGMAPKVVNSFENDTLDLQVVCFVPPIMPLTQTISRKLVQEVVDFKHRQLQVVAQTARRAAKGESGSSFTQAHQKLTNITNPPLLPSKEVLDKATLPIKKELETTQTKLAATIEINKALEEKQRQSDLVIKRISKDNTKLQQRFDKLQAQHQEMITQQEKDESDQVASTQLAFLGMQKMATVTVAQIEEEQAKTHDAQQATKEAQEATKQVQRVLDKLQVDSKKMEQQQKSKIHALEQQLRQQKEQIKTTQQALQRQADKCREQISAKEQSIKDNMVSQETALQAYWKNELQALRTQLTLEHSTTLEQQLAVHEKKWEAQAVAQLAIHLQEQAGVYETREAATAAQAQQAQQQLQELQQSLTNMQQLEDTVTVLTVQLKTVAHEREVGEGQLVAARAATTAKQALVESMKRSMEKLQIELDAVRFNASMFGEQTKYLISIANFGALPDGTSIETALQSCQSLVAFHQDAAQMRLVLNDVQQRFQLCQNDLATCKFELEQCRQSAVIYPSAPQTQLSPPMTPP